MQDGLVLISLQAPVALFPVTGGKLQCPVFGKEIQLHYSRRRFRETFAQLLAKRTNWERLQVSLDVVRFQEYWKVFN